MRKGLFAVLLLAGCGPTISPTSEMEQRLNDRIDKLDGRLDQIEQNATGAEVRVTSAEARATAAEDAAAQAGSGLSSLANTVSSNARIANGNARLDMTRRGACGTELYYDEAGVPRQRFRECRNSDLGR